MAEQDNIKRRISLLKVKERCISKIKNSMQTNFTASMVQLVKDDSDYDYKTIDLPLSKGPVQSLQEWAKADPVEVARWMLNDKKDLSQVITCQEMNLFDSLLPVQGGTKDSDFDVKNVDAPVFKGSMQSPQEFESPLKRLTTKLACSALHSLGVYKRKSCQGTSSQDMDIYCRNMVNESEPSLGDIIQFPSLCIINEPTNFSVTSSMAFPLPDEWGTKARMFEDNQIEMGFRYGGSLQLLQEAKLETVPLQFKYLGAKAATTSLSRLGKYFSFDSFSKMYQNQQRKHKSSKNDSSQSQDSKHEAPGRNCPMKRSFQAATTFLPSMAKTLKPPSRVNFSCPPAIVAARAALSATRSAKILIPPQASLLQILVIAVMGVAANVPLSMWRQHTQTFSLSWFTAVFAAVPFVYVLSKSVLMSHTFSFSIATCLLGQVIGTMAERYHSGAVATTSPPPPQTESDYVFLIQLAISVWIVSFRVSSHDTSLHVSRRRASQNSSPTI